MTDTPKRCEARVTDPPHYINTRQCERKGNMVWKDRDLCPQHFKMAEAGRRLLLPRKEYRHDD